MNAALKTPAKTKVGQALQIVFAISEAIREAKEIPSGNLYAILMAHGCSMSQYDEIINTLKGAKLIEVTPSFLIRWIGPKVAQ